MICPDCDGVGKQLYLFVIKQDETCSPCEILTCIRCEGRGNVPDEMAEWIRVGKLLKDTRLSHKKTLREQAIILGLKPSELSAMEYGRIKPVNPEHVNWMTQ
jgi:hypothetical protein